MRKFNFRTLFFAILLGTIFLFTSCSLYKVTVFKSQNTEQNKTTINKYLKDKRRFVLQQGPEAWELKNASIDDKNNVLIGVLKSLPVEKIKLKTKEGYHKLQNGKDEGEEKLDVHISTSIIEEEIALIKYSLVLSGDDINGWRGASVNVYINDSLIFDSITLPYGKNGKVFNFSVMLGGEIRILYCIGSNPSQNNYYLCDGFNGTGVIKYLQLNGKPKKEYTFIAQKNDYNPEDVSSSRSVKIKLSDIDRITEYHDAPIASFLTKIPIGIGVALVIGALVWLSNSGPLF